MRILVADDHVAFSNALQDMLGRWGYEPLVVHDGQEALRVLESPAAPQLAVLDWVMPGLDGVEVCRRLRQRDGTPYTYVVLLTGQGGRQEMLDGLESGADDYLVKPVDVLELRARLNTGRRILGLQEQLLATQRQLREQASRDALTGLWNRAAILEILDRELARRRREGGPVGVLMADLDHFKQVNDTHGHPAGDQVLRQAAGRMKAVVRPYDTVGRYGGEEFLVVLPGCGLSAAESLGERLRHSLAAEPVAVEGGPLQVTLSLGVAAAEGGTELTATELLRAADAALYRAKRAGRNRVALAGEPAFGPPRSAALRASPHPS